MNPKFEIILPGEGNYNELLEYLSEIDQTHIPSISSRVNLQKWTRKLIDNATLFIYRVNGKIVACMADYVNKAPELTFGTHLSVKHEYAEYLLGPQLIRETLKYSRDYGAAGRWGKVRESYKALVNFYKKLGYEVTEKSFFPNSDVSELTLKIIFNENNNHNGNKRIH